MNVVAMIHKTGESMARTLLPVWRRSAAAGQLVIVRNPDCSADWPGADRIVDWPCDPGHNGIDQCRRHQRCAELAAELPGVTAIVEPDAFLTRAAEDVSPGCLWGSRIWDAKDELKDTGYIARYFPHPPYVALQADWARLADTMGWWLASNKIFDSGHNDRVLGLAAQVAGLRLVGKGFSRNTVALWEGGELRKAIEHGATLIHGTKEPRVIAWWLTEQGFMEASDTNLWDEMGIEPDKREIPWAMDLRHINALRRVAELVRPKTIVEIGSHRGHSTAGFLKALETLTDATLHLVEPAPTPDLLALLERSPVKDRVVLHRDSSWELGELMPDFVFIDGSHEWPALADLAWCLASQTAVIAIHDTRSHFHGIGGCWGAQLAADILRTATGREWIADEERRPGEWTHRGLGLSVCNLYLNFTGDPPEEFNLIKAAFRGTATP
jgi:hypothetical protein